MLLLNFAHPFTESQRAQLGALVGTPLDNVLDIKTQFDPNAQFAAQVVALVDSVGLSREQWQNTPLLVNPPSLSAIACAVLAELHGRMGYFPTIVRLRPVTGAVPPTFEVAEVVGLNTIREEARRRR